MTRPPLDFLQVLYRGMVVGSTGAAALNCGRRFAGIEINPKYYELASSRLRSRLL